MLKNCEEKPLEALLKCPKSWLLILLLVASAASLSYNFYSSDGGDDLDWKCPSCPLNPSSPKITPSPAPSPGPTTLSHVVFAIGASAATWHSRRSYSQLWWDPALVRGHVWLDRAPETLLRTANDTTCPPIRISADSSRFGNRASASRIARIVAESYELELGQEEDGARWFVMGDDDTVFFTENLVSVLNKYDHNEMYYIGAPSESVEQDEMHSYKMAFGGGGFAVSLPAARELARAMDGCLHRYRFFWGSDQRVQACLSEIGVPLTAEPGFHQVDLRGDAYGMLAAHPIAPLVSLHHLDSVKPITPLATTQLDALKSLLDASKPDPARILQQTFCYVLDRAYNWSVSISWGYTVQIYPWILAPNELEVPLRTFRTWRSYKDGPFVFNTRPFRPDLECERPVMYFLNRVQIFNKGTVNTTVTEYLKFKPEETKGRGCDRPGFAAASRVSLVRVISLRLNQNFWQKAPRRQCCETRRIKRGTTMEVRIRDCYPGEITSPP